jgi:hypothetical protein
MIFMKPLNWYGTTKLSKCIFITPWHPLTIYHCSTNITATTTSQRQGSINDLCGASQLVWYSRMVGLYFIDYWHPLAIYHCGMGIGATTTSECQRSVNYVCEAAKLVWYSRIIWLCFHRLLASSSNISLWHRYWCHHYKWASMKRQWSLWSCSIGMVQPNYQTVFLSIFGIL